MKNTKLRGFLSAFSLFSILWMTTVTKAAPVRFSQVVQIVNAKPGKANTGGFTQLRLVGNDNLVTNQTAAGDNDPKPSSTPPPPQDGRVIVETRSDIVEDEACDCDQPVIDKGGFPKYALLGLAAIPFLFLIPPGRRRTPTPTPPTTETPTPETPTPQTPTPPETPTPPPPTPPMTPTPEPVPEPITILLFGTGLAGIGVAARKRFRRKGEEEAEDES